ncbi:MAG TPA: endonuclease/exonuclease/phosphatase family protein [Myxococcota bacterium]|nr:endonuclease/exonuclease/phosphatase family protein [Myxococcota bacterium]
MLSATADGSAFRDAKACAESIARGERLERAGEVVRVVTWNVRWFPDGGPGKTAGTNLEWLACALAWLDADVFMLQEIKRSPSAAAAMESVVDQLARHTRAKWQVAVDDCPHPESQHLAMLYRSDRVAVTDIATRGEIDPTVVKKAQASCPGRLRPALTGYVRSLRGGLDFHLATVHLDSGKEERDQNNRREAWRRIETLTHSMQTARADDDVIVLGDFNTMGCRGCGIPTAAAELAAMIDALRGLSFPYRIASLQLGCSEYYNEHGTLLDHVLIAATMQEADDAPVRVSGICSALACKKLDAAHVAVMAELSDHCPVVVDVPDHDIDGS